MRSEAEWCRVIGTLASLDELGGFVSALRDQGIALPERAQAALDARRADLMREARHG